MKELCMNMVLIISSKYNMITISMVRIVISKATYLEIDPKDYLYPGTIAKVSV